MSVGQAPVSKATFTFSRGLEYLYLYTDWFASWANLGSTVGRDTTLRLTETHPVFKQMGIMGFFLYWQSGRAYSR
jgi:hypothetical protein